ncbi:cyclase family protein [Umbelopsis sp. AD052]|nr:cyclase family protein [Umbelopsis sp. AD052]
MRFISTILASAALLQTAFAASATAQSNGLWSLYYDHLESAKYIDLTHTITPYIPVWAGFGNSNFSRAVDPKTNEIYTYAKDGFEATAYNFKTDQLGTQFDPPAHWDPFGPAIDEIPATVAVRPLVVIDITAKVKKDFGYQMEVADIHAYEKKYGKIPKGSVVFIRSDWSKKWPSLELPLLTKFPGITLPAIKYLHNQRSILFHGHEPLDTDDTPTLESEDWVLHHGHPQAEGVANLDKVAPKGCLVNIGFPKLAGGTGGYARYIAICPSTWKYGISPKTFPEAPLRKYKNELLWDDELKYRLRKDETYA